MPAVFEHSHTVTADEIDDLGHASNLFYLRWTQAAAIAHSAVQGWPVEAYRRLGAGFVVRSHRIEYLRPALLGDEIIVRTWVADFRRTRSLRKYQIRHAQQRAVLAEAETLWAFVNFASGRPARVPPELKAAFEVVGEQVP